MEAMSAAPDRLIKLGVAFRDSKTLLSAVELGVFTLLAEAPLELETLAEKAGIEPVEACTLVLLNTGQY